MASQGLQNYKSANNMVYTKSKTLEIVIKW